MLLLTNFPPDIRVEKEIGSLKNHRIHILCTRRGSLHVQNYEELGNVRVTRLFDKPIRSITNLQLFFFRKSWIWERQILRFVQDNKIDVLHVHDLPLAGSAYKVANKLNIKLVVDLHENYPEMLRESKRKKLTEEFTIPQFIIKLTSIRKWKNYERNILKQVENIIVVIEEAKERLVRELKISSDKIHVIPNFDIIREFDHEKPPKETINFVYSGGFDSVRDLRTIVKAVEKIKPEIKEKIIVKLIGGEGKEYRALQELVDDLGVKDIVKLYPFMPFEEMYKHLLSSDIGLVAHKKSEHTDNTIPHKLFQYMNLGMPVIVSNCTPLQRIINKSRCGLIYEAENESSLAAVFEKIYNSPNERILMSTNSKKAINEYYNWGICETRINKLYNNLN